MQARENANIAFANRKLIKLTAFNFGDSKPPVRWLQHAEDLRIMDVVEDVSKLLLNIQEQIF